MFKSKMKLSVLFSIISLPIINRVMVEMRLNSIYRQMALFNNEWFLFVVEDCNVDVTPTYQLPTYLMALFINYWSLLVAKNCNVE